MILRINGFISLSRPTESSSATDDGYYFPLPRTGQDLLRATVPVMVVKIFLCTFNWLLIVLGTECVLCEVWTEVLRSIYIYIYISLTWTSMAVEWFKWLAADTSLWMLGFDPRPNHIKFVAGKKSTSVFPVCNIPPALHTRFHFNFLVNVILIFYLIPRIFKVYHIVMELGTQLFKWRRTV